MKVNILGTPYKVKHGTANKYPVLQNADGACDSTIKTIYLADIEPAPGLVEDLDAYTRKVLRHELVHAFLDESGLTEYSRDETLVDWIAVQAPKMIEAFRRADAI